MSKVVYGYSGINNPKITQQYISEIDALIAFADYQFDQTLMKIDKVKQFPKKVLIESFYEKHYIQTLVVIIKNNYQKPLSSYKLFKLKLRAIKMFNQDLFFQLRILCSKNGLEIKKEILDLDNGLFIDYEQFKTLDWKLLNKFRLKIIFYCLQFTKIFSQYINYEWQDSNIILRFLDIANHLLSLRKKLDKYCLATNTIYSNENYKEFVELGKQYSQICVQFEITKQLGVELYSKRKYMEAITFIKQNINEGNPKQFQIIAKCLLKLGRYWESHQFLQKSLFIKPFATYIKLENVFKIWDIENQRQEGKRKEGLFGIQIDDDADSFCIEI